MAPTEQSMQLLQAFAGGRKKSYPQICRQLGIPLTPLAPSEVRSLCEPLLRASLIERSGMRGDKFRLTERGERALANGEPTRGPAASGARGTTRPAVARRGYSPADPNAPGDLESGAPSSPRTRPAAGSFAASGSSHDDEPPTGSRTLPLAALWATGILLLPALSVVFSTLGQAVGLDPPWMLTAFAWGMDVFVVAVGTTRIVNDRPLGPGALLLQSFLVVPVSFVAMLLATGLGQALGSRDVAFHFAVGALLGIAIPTILVSARTARSGSRAWVAEVGGARLGEPDVPREKSMGFAYLLLSMVGIFGGHRYYLGYYASAVLYTCTLGLCLVGVFVDFFLTPKLTRKANQRIWMQWFDRPDGEWVRVEGTARDVSGAQYESRETKGGGIRRVSMNFRVEELDGNGDIVRRVPVEVVGVSFTGIIRNGDTVRLTGKRSEENIVRTLAVENVSTGSKVVASFL